MKMPPSLQGKYGSQVGYCDKDWFYAGMNGAEIAAMLKFTDQCRGMGTRVILSAVPPQPRQTLLKMCEKHTGCELTFADTFENARTRAKALLDA